MNHIVLSKCWPIIRALYQAYLEYISEFYYRTESLFQLNSMPYSSILDNFRPFFDIKTS